MHDWDDIRFFLAIVQTGSVSAAAGKLKVNQSTVSRRINNFEKEMNVRLFERLSTGYQLTHEGMELQQRAIRMEEEMFAIERDIMGKNVALHGPIRLTTSLVMVDYLLMPILKAFTQQYPGIEVQLDLSDNNYNISQREADVALRVTRAPVPENLIGRELGAIELGVYAEKNYLRRYLKSKKGRVLHWVGEDNNNVRPDWLHQYTEPIQLLMRTNDVIATTAAVKNGLGVGRLPRLIGEAMPQLVRFEDTPILPNIPLWLLTHVDMRRVSRVKVFNAFLADKIKEAL